MIELHTTDCNEDGKEVDVFFYVDLNDGVIEKVIRDNEVFTSLDALEKLHGVDLITKLTNLVETRIEEESEGLWDDTFR